MKRPFVTFEPFDVVTMPFPFADKNKSIVRPAVILTDHMRFGALAGIAIVAMISSAKHSAWPYDVPVSDLQRAGLLMPCIIRMKLNAVDLKLMERKIGYLGDGDIERVKVALKSLLPV